MAHLIGIMTSTSLAVLLSPLHYRMLQMLHPEVLSRSQQGYDSYILWAQEACQELPVVD